MMMHDTEDLDEFQLLENKIDALVDLVSRLRNEKARLSEQLAVQEGKAAELTDRIDRMEANREKAKQRISAMLEKIEQIGT
ncbi:MAG: hypothetical protein DRH37_08425 [Deltaproteobacteria bacterium]|nr:MAG: hypothetical protein DRH37_08425 [Deltaproteobacteria bacterium]